MYVCVFIAVCLCVSVSLDDLWFVFTLPYFRPACRHRRMNDKLRTSIGFTPAPVVPGCPRAQWQESSRDEYIKKHINRNTYWGGGGPTVNILPENIYFIASWVTFDLLLKKGEMQMNSITVLSLPLSTPPSQVKNSHTKSSVPPLAIFIFATSTADRRDFRPL